MATFDRIHLLNRSLSCYERQAFDNDRFELVVIDDHSTDATAGMVHEWSRATGIRATVLTVSPKPAEWTDCGWVLNAGIRAAAGDFILLTHPEVMPGRRSVAACVEVLEKFEAFRRGGFPIHEYKDWGIRLDLKSPPPFGMYAACRVYYMSPACQTLIDTVDWPADPLAVRTIPGFYDPIPGGNPHYHPAFMDKVGTPGCEVQTWDSFVFSGMSRETWKRFGGLVETEKWGSVDILWNDRRKKLSMVEWTAPGDDTIVIHQNHDLPGNVPTVRDMPTWVAECKTKNLGHLCYPDVDNLGWS